MAAPGGPMAAQPESDEKEEKDTCFICLDASDVSLVANCRHCFAVAHRDCLAQWLKTHRSCPMCHAALSLDQRCFCGRAPLGKSSFSSPISSSHQLVSVPGGPALPPPGSCGTVCSRPLRGCSHRCSEPCHPGVCPPCPVTTRVQCVCGEKTFLAACGQGRRTPRCEKACTKVLPCCGSVCNRPCHTECPPCEREVTGSCHCGKQSEVSRKCGEATVFSCAEPCRRTLECKEHKCERPCHAGPCPPCPRSPALVSSCACGRTPLSSLPASSAKPRATCTDPLPTCSEKCGRRLACGKHGCKEGCHDGECPPCQQPVPVPCRCGRSSIPMLCGDITALQQAQRESEGEAEGEEANGTVGAGAGAPEAKAASPPLELLCNRVCTRLLPCGLHRCSRQCCELTPAGHRDCEAQCGEELLCGHRCTAPCHRGRCPPCSVVLRGEIKCRCGRKRGQDLALCGQFSPEGCGESCLQPRECSHPCRQPCHPGPCPPCVDLVEKPCACGQTRVKNQPCGRKAVFCGKVCSRPLSCSRHLCPKRCHAGPCEAAPTSSSSLSVVAAASSARESKRDTSFSSAAPSAAAAAPQQCSKPCGATRSDCGHKCTLPCHGLTDCPISTVPCGEPLTEYCPCRRRKREITCGELRRRAEQKEPKERSAEEKEKADGHPLNGLSLSPTDVAAVGKERAESKAEEKEEQEEKPVVGPLQCDTQCRAARTSASFMRELAEKPDVPLLPWPRSLLASLVGPKNQLAWVTKMEGTIAQFVRETLQMEGRVNRRVMINERLSDPVRRDFARHLCIFSNITLDYQTESFLCFEGDLAVATPVLIPPSLLPSTLARRFRAQLSLGACLPPEIAFAEQWALERRIIIAFNDTERATSARLAHLRKWFAGCRCVFSWLSHDEVAVLFLEGEAAFGAYKALRKTWANSLNSLTDEVFPPEGWEEAEEEEAKEQAEKKEEEKEPERAQPDSSAKRRRRLFAVQPAPRPGPFHERLTLANGFDLLEVS